MTPPDSIQSISTVPENWLACHDCDLLIEREELPVGFKASCPRCGQSLYQNKRNSVERSFALSITGLLLFVPANLLPVMSLQILGLQQSTTIYQGALAIFKEGLYWTASLVFIASIVVPLAKILLMLFVSGSLYLKQYTPLLPYAFRYYHYLDEWGMLEVYMLGILVSVVKLKGMATVIPDTGLICFVGLLLVTTLLSSMMDEEDFWEKIEHGLDNRGS